ncbi:hypothetical protein GC194_12475 [bacterium]|nr:hypothetical protein [bacterium]
MTQEMENVLDKLFALRKEGADFAGLRAYLAQEQFDEATINELMREFSHRELEELEVAQNTLSKRVVWVLCGALVLAAPALWFWIDASETLSQSGLHWLAALPLLGAVGVYLIFRHNTQKSSRVGSHTRFRA